MWSIPVSRCSAPRVEELPEALPGGLLGRERGLVGVERRRARLVVHVVGDDRLRVADEGLAVREQPRLDHVPGGGVSGRRAPEVGDDLGVRHLVLHVHPDGVVEGAGALLAARGHREAVEQVPADRVVVRLGGTDHARVVPVVPGRLALSVEGVVVLARPDGHEHEVVLEPEPGTDDVGALAADVRVDDGAEAVGARRGRPAEEARGQRAQEDQCREDPADERGEEGEPGGDGTVLRCFTGPTIAAERATSRETIGNEQLDGPWTAARGGSSPAGGVLAWPLVTRLAPAPPSSSPPAAVVVAGAVSLAGCSTVADGSSHSAVSGETGHQPASRRPDRRADRRPRHRHPRRGLRGPRAPAAPEATVSPAPGSWDDVAPPAGYRVVLLSPGDPSPETETLADAVDAWAEAEDVTVVPVVADSADDRCRPSPRPSASVPTW